MTALVPCRPRFHHGNMYGQAGRPQRREGMLAKCRFGDKVDCRLPIILHAVKPIFMHRHLIVILLVFFSFIGGHVAAQDGPRPKTRTADLMLGFGGGVTNVATSYQYAWKYGKKQRLTMGIGMRFNGFFASDKYFVTAPARIVKGEGGPQAFFKEAIPDNMDSVLIPSASIFALNFMVNIGYSISDRLSAGFNIDVIGISFGKQQPGVYINGNAPDGITSKPVEAAPTGFNLLLIGENDIGSLNSELFVAYKLDERWTAKLGIQHTFMEYTTTTKVQQLPEANDRFRITPTVVCVGVGYTLR